jgi:hypothetical protein
LRTQKSITAAIVTSEMIVGIVDRRMDIEQGILK